MKKHIEEKYNVVCLRADERSLTIPILDKINRMIVESDFIIADCSGRNPNVMYEIGLAHANGKKVILLTSDEISTAPSDIKHYEFIKYALEKDVEFTHNLDCALHVILFEEYEQLYLKAQELFRKFKSMTNVTVQIASKDEFISCIRHFESVEGTPDLNDQAAMVHFLLPKNSR